MDITVNHQSYTIPESCTLQQMLDVVIQQSLMGMAVAVNQQIISKSQWATHSLKASDNITLIKATQGG